MKFAELELEINAIGYFNGIADSLGIGAEGGGHFIRRFDVKLVGIEAPAGFVGERLAGLDAEQNLVGLGVVAMEIMTIVSGDQRNSGVTAEIGQGAIEGTVEAVVLQFEIEAAREGFRVPLGGIARPVHAVGFQGAGDLAREAARQDDQTFGIFGENFLVDTRLIVQSFFVGGG